MEAIHEERRSVVASGKTVEDAIANGLQMLGVRRDQVDIEVLSEGSRGVLGFGAENARVKLQVKPPRQPKPPQPVVAAPPPEEELATTAGPSTAQEPSLSEDSPEWLGKQYLAEILEQMGIPATVEISKGYELAEEGEAPPIVLNITGEDLGILIGRRGETLRAIQYLIRLMVSHQTKHWSNLLVDVEQYRVRRHQALESLAERVAERVAKEGRAQTLEPMPAYERRIVHIALRKNPHVTTRSIGEGERRKVTIIPV